MTSFAKLVLPVGGTQQHSVTYGEILHMFKPLSPIYIQITQQKQQLIERYCNCTHNRKITKTSIRMHVNKTIFTWFCFLHKKITKTIDIFYYRSH